MEFPFEYYNVLSCLISSEEVRSSFFPGRRPPSPPRSIRNFHVPEVWQFPPTFQSGGSTKLSWYSAWLQLKRSIFGRIRPIGGIFRNRWEKRDRSFLQNFKIFATDERIKFRFVYPPLFDFNSWGEEEGFSTSFHPFRLWLRCDFRSKIFQFEFFYGRSPFEIIAYFMLGISFLVSEISRLNFTIEQVRILFCVTSVIRKNMWKYPSDSNSLSRLNVNSYFAQFLRNMKIHYHEIITRCMDIWKNYSDVFPLLRRKRRKFKRRAV